MDDNKRKFARNELKRDVIVNEGVPYLGGKLLDMSVGGAAVVYPEIPKTTSGTLQVGQPLVLNIEGIGLMPGRVVRTFDKGFATVFDFSVPVRTEV